MSIQAIGTWFVTLAVAWGNSCKMLLPGNLKLLALVTLKAIGMFYKEASRKLWWLFVLYAGVQYVATVVYPVRVTIGSISLAWLASAVWFALLFCYYLFARSSIDKKDWSYLRCYGKHAVLLGSVLLLYSVVNDLGAALAGYVDDTIPLLSPLLAICAIVLISVALLAGLPDLLLSMLPSFLALNLHQVLPNTVWPLMPLFSLFVFFFLDIQWVRVASLFKSFWRALLMFLYNLPFCLVLSIVLLVVYAFTQQYVLMPSISLALKALGSTDVDTLAAFWLEVITMLLMPVAICCWSTLYIKRARDQFTLYCGKQC